MPNLTSVGVTAGVPTSGTGTVSTIDNLIGTAGTAAAQVLSIQGIAGGTAQAVSQSGDWEIAIDEALPAGTNLLGKITTNDGTNSITIKAASTAPLATDTAEVVSLSPNSAGIISFGQTTKSASVPVTIASDHFGGATPANSLPVVNAGFTYAHISTSATTTVKSGAGVVHTITVNNLGTVASTTTVYDNTAGSGTIIAVLNTLAGQTSYIYDVAFATGLTLVTTGTVAPDITVSYR